MSENFTKSKNYQRLLEQLRVGKRVTCTGVHVSFICQDSSQVAFMLDFDAKTGILSSQVYFRKPEILDDEKFFAACRRLDLEFFDEAEAPKLPEPNMFWLPEMKETSAVGDPDHIVEFFARKDFVTVKCAVRLPDRTMRLWLDEDDETRWEWVDETPTKSTHP